jgi:hypothetical protein
MTDEMPQGPAPASAGTLPGNLTAAAVVLLVFGALDGLASVLMLLAAVLAGARHMTVIDDPRLMGGSPGLPWVMDGGHAGFMGLLFLLLLALLGAAVTGSHVAAGWGILQRRSWGRLLGVVVSATALVVLLVGLAATLVWAAAGIAPDLADYPRQMRMHYRSAMGATIALGTVLTLLAAAAYGFVLWVLARHPDAPA